VITLQKTSHFYSEV